MTFCGRSQAGWLRCLPVRNDRLAAALAFDLDASEAEAIALATEIPADVLLIDEKEGRSLARQAGRPSGPGSELYPPGLLGVFVPSW